MGGIPVWDTGWREREFAPDEVVEEVSCRPVDDSPDGLPWQGNRLPTEEDFEQARRNRDLPSEEDPGDDEDDPDAPAGEAENATP